MPGIATHRIEFITPTSAAPTCRSVFTSTGTPWLAPVQIAASTVARLACDQHTIASVRDVMGRLSDDDYLVYLRAYYDHGLETFGANWDYADLLTVLHAGTTLLQPRSVLEIGVRRGRSLATIASCTPTCSIIGFDLWIDNYAGMSNPGPRFVEDELTRIGHTGPLTLISGDSHETVPQYLAEHPDVTFDLINVDGDHTEAGARADLAAVLPHLALGGMVVLDDIVHPQHPYLEDVWDDLVGSDDRFSCLKYRDLGYGVAAAIRRM